MSYRSEHHFDARNTDERQNAVVDLFAGGGGASVAIEAALERPVDIAINHNDVALRVHEANHPRTKHFVSDVWEVEPRVATRGRPVFVLWASPSCTHFSRARSGVPKSEQDRSHADVVLRWVEQTRPQFVFVENVVEFLTWGPLYPDDYPNEKLRGRPIPERKGEFFLRWKQSFESHGYSIDWRVLDSADYGAHTRRRRLFVVARRDGEPIAWPRPSHGNGLEPYRTAADCIDWSIEVPSIFGRKRELAEKTKARIAEGIRRYVFESDSPYIVRGFAPLLIQTGYGERRGQAPRVLNLHAPMGTAVAGGCKQALIAVFLTRHFSGVYGQSLVQPTSTITAQDHHSLTAVALDSQGSATVASFLSQFGVDPRPIIVDGVERSVADIGMRMLKPHELLRAQFGQFADGYDLEPAITDTNKIRLIGNSVPPAVARAVIAANCRRGRRSSAA